MKQQHEIDPFYTTPRVLVPDHVWVGAKETAVALGMVPETPFDADHDYGAGRLPSPPDLPWKALGIRAVICPAFNVSFAYDQTLPSLRLIVDDYDTLDPAVFDLAVAFHRLHGEATFVHCQGGRNRSAAFALALATACHGFSLESAAGALNRPTDQLWASLQRWAGR